MGWSGWSEIARECLDYFNSSVDYRKYDNNEDGIIVGIYLIWAGSQKSGFWWSYYGGLSLHDRWDGLKVQNAVIAWYSNDQDGPFQPGVICHETGHLLGLPDYYDYDYSIGPKGGLGGFDMMDGNAVDHNCFSKYLLDWIRQQ
jgi:M6 family metalloprotease-like protein